MALYKLTLDLLTYLLTLLLFTFCLTSPGSHSRLIPGQAGKYWRKTFYMLNALLSSKHWKNKHSWLSLSQKIIFIYYFYTKIQHTTTTSMITCYCASWNLRHSQIHHNLPTTCPVHQHSHSQLNTCEMSAAAA